MNQSIKKIILSVFALVFVSMNMLAGSCDTLCKGIGTKKYYVSGVSNATGYKWTTTGGISIVGGQGTDTITVSLASATAGINTVSVKPYNTCDSMATTTFNVFVIDNSFTPSAGSAQTICYPAGSNAVSLTGSTHSGYTTLWSKISGPAGGTITSASNSNTTVTGLTNFGTYVYRYTVSQGGCSTFSDVNITLNETPVANIDKDKDTICIGASSTLLGAYTYNGSGTVNVRWRNSSNGIVANTNAYSPFSINNTFYSFEAYTNTCTSFDTVSINVIKAPIAIGDGCFNLTQGQVLNLSIPTQITANDDVSTQYKGYNYTVQQNPSTGSLSILGSVLTFTPNANTVGGANGIIRLNSVGCSFNDTSFVCIIITPKVLDNSTSTNVNTPLASTGSPVIVGPNSTSSITASSKQGTTFVNPDGTVKYTPNPNFVGTDTIKKIVCITTNSNTICDTSLTFVNVAPNYPDTSLIISQGTPVTSGTPVLTMPGSTTTITPIGPSNGTATVNPDGTVTYTPTTGFVGRDTVKRIVCVTFADATTICDTSLLVFVVTPSYADVVDSTPMNIGKVIGTPITTTAGTSVNTTASASNGTVTVNPDGTIAYTPKVGFVGIDTVKRIVCLYDSATMITKCDTSLIIMNVYPSVKDELTTTTVNSPISSVGGPVLAGPGTTVAQTVTSSNGTTTINPDGSIKYVPDTNFVGTDTIVRIICATNTLGTKCDTSLIIVNVAPSYLDTSVATFIGQPKTAGTPVLTMPGSTTSITTQGPSNGTATINPDGTVTYTPNSSFVGIDTVKRIVCVTFTDATTKCDTSLLIFNVLPIKIITTTTTPMNTPIGVGTPISGTGVTVTASATNGTTTVNPDGTITYVPKPNTVGTDTIKRVICFTTGTTTICDTSTIIVNVSPNYPDTTATTPTGVPVTAGSPVIVSPGSTSDIKATASNGSVTVNPDGTVSYTPRVGFVGFDTVKRVVCITYANGTSKCDTSLIVIRVTGPTGTNPTGTNPTGTGSTTGVSTGTGNPVTIGPAIVAGAGTTVTQTATANNGSVTINPDGTITYNPNTGFSGVDTITRIVCVTYPDGKTICDTSYIIVNVGEITIPNYFSPNGDGKDDNFVIPASIYAKYPNLKMTIYNRWGNIVWRSTGKYNNDWHGQSLGSELPVPDGVYYYLIELNSEFRETKTGFVEVMRQ